MRQELITCSTGEEAPQASGPHIAAGATTVHRPQISDPYADHGYDDSILRFTSRKNGSSTGRSEFDSDDPDDPDYHPRKITPSPKSDDPESYYDIASSSEEEFESFRGRRGQKLMEEDDYAVKDSKHGGKLTKAYKVQAPLTVKWRGPTEGKCVVDIGEIVTYI